jgi:hypothetical protein
MSDFEELDERDRALAQRLRQRLRAGEELDYVTQARLSAARARAVAAAEVVRGHAVAPRHTGWWAAGGLAAAAALAVLLVVRTPHAVVPATADALELLTDDVDPEFYQDLDMYQWLADSGAGSA